MPRRASKRAIPHRVHLTCGNFTVCANRQCLGMPRGRSVGVTAPPGHHDRKGKGIEGVSGRGSHDGFATTGAGRHLLDQLCCEPLELAVAAAHHINPGKPPNFSSCVGDHALAVTAFQIRGSGLADGVSNEMERGGHDSIIRCAPCRLLRGKVAIYEELVRNLLSVGAENAPSAQAGHHVREWCIGGCRLRLRARLHFQCAGKSKPRLSPPLPTGSTWSEVQDIGWGQVSSWSMGRWHRQQTSPSRFSRARRR